MKRVLRSLSLSLLSLLMGMSAIMPLTTEIIQADTASRTLRVHFQTQDDYDMLGLWVWKDVLTESETTGAWPQGATSFKDAPSDGFGRYLDIPIKADAKVVGMLINNTSGANLTGDIMVDIVSSKMNDIWIYQDGTQTHIEPITLPDNTVRIHYSRMDQSYDDLGLWLWDDVSEPSTGVWPSAATPFSNLQQSKYGAYIDVSYTEDAHKIGFLVVNRSSGDKVIEDLNFENLTDYKQVFIHDDEQRIYFTPFYESANIITAVRQTSDTAVELNFNTVAGLDVDVIAASVSLFKGDTRVDYENVLIDSQNAKIVLEGAFTIAGPTSLHFDDAIVPITKTWQYRDNDYAYEGELGATLFSDGSAQLKLWSPSASSVRVVLYDKNDPSTIITKSLPMILGDQGVWSIDLDSSNTGLESLRSYYYHYEIERDGVSTLVLDPYAKSMAPWNSDDGIKVGKAAIVDPSTLGPELSFADIKGYETREDAIIYEAHVRDFTSDPSIDNDLNAEFGTFSAFIDKLDYIQDLGVTHIQLLPVMSYYFVDEMNRERNMDFSSSDNNYNWGYDPHSYFSISGMYSEDPSNPEKRIEELKQLVDAIHQRKMGIILDVVYNHTAQTHIFEDLEPNYYHFMDFDGTPRTSFGGGRLGTTHAMSQRVLVDSILYLVDEFKVDGFRFDMMGDHDAETIQKAFDEAKALNPKVLMIGEGWITYYGDDNEPRPQAADQSWMASTEAVGSFSDEIRNELKSGFGSEGQARFLTGGARNIGQIFRNLTANPDNFVADHPGDVVQYIAAHDNLTLHDVIAQSIKKDPAQHEEEIMQRQRLGNLMILTAQGTAFLHSGQEYGRTKQFKSESNEAPYKSTYMSSDDGTPFTFPYFIHDSYDSSDAINLFDWSKVTDPTANPYNVMTRDFTRGMIEIRRSTDAFSHKSKADVDEYVSIINSYNIHENDLVIAYHVQSKIDETEFLVVVNADSVSRSIETSQFDKNLLEGRVIVDSQQADLSGITTPVGVAVSAHEITLDPLSATVIRFGVDRSNILDTDALEALINRAEALEPISYTDVSFNNLTAVLQEAKLLVKTATTQNEIDSMVRALSTAIESLVSIKLDTAALEATLAEIKTINREPYTQESLGTLDLLVIKANNLLDNLSSTNQKALDAVNSDLRTAINNLVVNVSIPETNLGDLSKAITKAEALVKEDYTQESFSVLELALTHAKSLLTKPQSFRSSVTVTQAAIDQAVLQIEAAIKQLVRVDKHEPDKENPKPEVSVPVVEQKPTPPTEQGLPTTGIQNSLTIVIASGLVILGFSFFIISQSKYRKYPKEY